MEKIGLFVFEGASSNWLLMEVINGEWRAEIKKTKRNTEDILGPLVDKEITAPGSQTAPV